MDADQVLCVQTNSLLNAGEREIEISELSNQRNKPKAGLQRTLQERSVITLAHSTEAISTRSEAQAAMRTVSPDSLTLQVGKAVLPVIQSCFLMGWPSSYHAQFPSRRLFAGLIAITGLGIFMTRVDANANEPAQASTEVHWPPGYSPTKADLFTHDEVVIHASPATVWNYLVAAEQWPRWYANSRDVRILNSEHILRPGSRFTWTTFGVRLESTVAECVPNKRLGWSSMHLDGSGIHSYHAWLLIPVADGCRLTASYGNPIKARRL